MNIQKLFFTAIVGVLSLSALVTPSLAGNSFWNHNGSQMLMWAQGSQRVISYYSPRPGISARAGQVVFRGNRVGNYYRGTAYTFRRGCRPAAYRVSGRLGSETLIVLRGAAPIREGCQIIGYSRDSNNATLVFEYIARAQEN